ncbi:MAG TPA: FAD-dependent oxidoreductase [Acidimicrobiales bacterium]|nr:MAG: CoA-disulfide reductase [Actinobacteria bacterium 21-73-9]HQU26028.1 FAD-dependent oxidoreductase [Acidimicrobiales bacterium]
MHLLAIGGSDGGISAALRARELDDAVEVTVMLDDEFPNFSICGIPYLVSGEVADWRQLAHRRREAIEALGISLLTSTTARSIDVAAHRVRATDAHGVERVIAYDRLVIATGATPVRPPIDGLDGLGAADGVHLVHTMGDAFEVLATLEQRRPERAVIVGAGYIGLEMAEALTRRGLAVSLVEALPQVLATLDPELADPVTTSLVGHGVDVRTATTVTEVARDGDGLVVRARARLDDGAATPVEIRAGIVLVVTGVTPDTELARAAGATTGARGAIRVDQGMATGLPDVFAAGDCVVTHHVLLGETYLPLGTTAHKQGRVAGENALGGDRRFAGSLGTQVVRVFDAVAARTGVRDREAREAGFDPRTVGASGDDHKAYYPGATTVDVRLTGDDASGRLLGVQLVGSVASAVHKRVDTAATAVLAGLTVDRVSDLDLAYTPPLGSPWDVLQVAAQRWLADGRARPARDVAG